VTIAPTAIVNIVPGLDGHSLHKLDEVSFGGEFPQVYLHQHFRKRTRLRLGLYLRESGLLACSRI
jgi:hypothetical protein